MRKSRFLNFADRQTDRQTDGHHRCVKPQSRYRELWLNKRLLAFLCQFPVHSLMFATSDANSLEYKFGLRRTNSNR